MSKAGPTTVRGTGLAAFTTLRVGGPAAAMVHAETETDLVAVVRELDAAGERVLVLGGGSNLVVSADGFAGTVVQVATRGITAVESACAGAEVTVAAGEGWDEFVALTVERDWSGLEALSGIPGLVGATPIQNVGAYGADVSQTVARVRTFDRSTGTITTVAAADCGFGYRDSMFKQNPDRYLVCSVTFQLPLGSLSAPIRYAEVARRLGVELGERVPTTLLRDTVLALRRGKGMVLDDADHDTWSVGSFFTNPIMSAAAAKRLPADAPRYPADGDLVKTSAAWLIEHAGYSRGYGAGPAQVSGKHTLALTNRGSATTEDVLELAREIRAGVEAAFGVTLVAEPTMINCEL